MTGGGHSSLLYSTPQSSHSTQVMNESQYTLTPSFRRNITLKSGQIYFLVMEGEWNTDDDNDIGNSNVAV